MIKFVKYGTPWCGPCITMERLLDLAKSEFPDIPIESVDISSADGYEAAKGLNILAVPTMIGYKDGAVISRTTGSVDYNTLKSLLENLKSVESKKE